MRILKASILVCAIFSACLPLNAGPVFHRFELWGKGTDLDRLNLYWGWGEGFFQGRGKRGLELADCLETITATQALAMIDKRYKDHPELWSNPLGGEILNAVTVAGGPCQGKNPFDTPLDDKQPAKPN